MTQDNSDANPQDKAGPVLPSTVEDAEGKAEDSGPINDTDTSSSSADAEPANDESQDQDAASKLATKALKQKRKMIRLTIAGVGFLAGSIFGAYVEELLARANPGFFGPDNQKVIDEQTANFANLDAKLKELKLNADKDPKAIALLGELGEMIQEQKNLAARKDEMFKATDIERQMLDDKLLKATETSGTVDFWLKVGESVILVDSDKVFALVNHYTSLGDVNVSLSGQQHRITVGDRLDFETTDGPRVVIFRHVKRESDGRYGFDLARPNELDEASN